jgi:hypothetical protein
LVNKFVEGGFQLWAATTDAQELEAH